MTFLKRLFCRHHNLQFVCNLPGDDVRDRDWKRSLWRCAHCQAGVSREGFYQRPLAALMEAVEHLSSDELHDAVEYLRSEQAVREQRK